MYQSLQKTIVVGAMLFVAMPVQAATMKVFNPEWRQCNDASQCVAVEEICAWTAVNARHQEAVAEYYQGMAATVECQKPAEAKEDDEALPVACIANHCEIKKVTAHDGH